MLYISYCSVGSVCILNQTSADMEIRVIYELWSFLPSFLYVSCHETRSSAKLKTGFLIFVETEAMFVLKVISLNFSSSDTRHLRGCTQTTCCFWIILHQGVDKCNLNTIIFFSFYYGAPPFSLQALFRILAGKVCVQPLTTVVLIQSSFESGGESVWLKIANNIKVKISSTENWKLLEPETQSASLLPHQRQWKMFPCIATYIFIRHYINQLDYIMHLLLHWLHIHFVSYTVQTQARFRWGPF